MLWIGRQKEISDHKIVFDVNAASEPDGFASTAMKLSEYRKIDPSKFEEIIFYDHPSGKARVIMAMKWKAEHLNKKPN